MAFISGSILAVGDSRTNGYLVTTAWPSLVGTALSTTVTNASHGAEGYGYNSGGTLGGTTLSSRAASEVDPHRTDNPPPFLLLFAAINDMYFGATGTQAWGYLEAYIAARISAGWNSRRIIVNTEIMRTGVTTQQRSDFNALIISGAQTYCYQLVRLDQNSTIGGDTSNLDANFFSDGVHPNQSGQQIIANLNAAVTLQRTKLTWS